MKYLLFTLALLFSGAAYAVKSPAILNVGGHVILSEIETDTPARVCMVNVDTNNTVCFFDTGKKLVDKKGNTLGYLLNSRLISKRDGL